MKDRDHSEGWYPNIFEKRIGLDPDPGRPTSEGSNRHRRKSSWTKVSRMEYRPQQPTLSDLHAVEVEREALKDEVSRLRKANRSLSEENMRWTVSFETRVREGITYALNITRNRRAYWSRYYVP